MSFKRTALLLVVLLFALGTVNPVRAEDDYPTRKPNISVSPDGQFVAFFCDPISFQMAIQVHLCIAQSNLERVVKSKMTVSRYFFPVWNDTSKKITFVCYNSKIERYDLCVSDPVFEVVWMAGAEFYFPG